MAIIEWLERFGWAQRYFLFADRLGLPRTAALIVAGVACLVAIAATVVVPLLVAGLVLLAGLVLMVRAQMRTNARRRALVETVRAGIVVPYRPEEAMSHLTAALASSRALVHSVVGSTMTGSVQTHKRPSILLALFLFWICFIPGVIYLITGRKDVTETFAVRVEPDGRGGSIVSGAGEGEALQAVLLAVQSLAGPAGI